MTIHLPEQVKNSILAMVHSGQFASVDDAMAEAARLLLRQLNQRETLLTQSPAVSSASPKRKPISEVFEEIRKGVPNEEWDKLPVDGAEQHDHYIYGLPKRPVS